MLYLVNARGIRKIRYDIANLRWAYFGGHKGLARARQILRDDRRIYIGKEIRNTAGFIRDNFVNYIGMVASQQTNPILWYSSPLASKAIYQTSVFKQYIFLKIIEKLSDSGEDVIIISDDLELLGNVTKAGFKDVRVVRGNGLYRALAFFKRLHGYRSILENVLFWLECKILGKKEAGRFNIFIHSWTDDRTFIKLPGFNDSYTRDLSDFLTAKGYAVGRFTSQKLPLRHVLKVSRNFKNVILPFSYLSLRDLLRMIFTKFIIELDESKITRISDPGILNMLVKDEARRENVLRNYTHYLLLLNSYKSLKKHVKKETTFIYTFENQPWEKMFNFAFAGFNRIGYQHSSIPYNQLDYRISAHETNMPIPDIILTSGERWSRFLKNYYSQADIQVAGAIRYPYLFGKEKRDYAQRDAHDIVLALPISPGIAISLQKQLLDYLKKGHLRQCLIKIKPHPYLPEFARLYNEFKKYRNCGFVKDNMDELLKDCALFITTSSTVVIESIFKNIKTLYFVPEELSFGFEDFFEDHLFIAYEEDFSKKLEDAMASSGRQPINMDEYFSRPDYDVFLKFVKGNTHV